MGDTVLTTARLRLRTWDADDVAPFMAHLNVPDVMAWLGGVQDAATFRAAYDRLQGYQRDFGHTFWIVERLPDGGHLSGELLGFCGLKRVNAEGAGALTGTMEIGWRLRSDAWGQGYAGEAARAALDAAFDRFGADTVVALTVDGNRASRALMERLGMRRDAAADFAEPKLVAAYGPTIVYRIDRNRHESPRDA